MVTAGDPERRRLERNLHDGAQQRLAVALLPLRRLEDRVAADPETVASVHSTREELAGAIEDLRELARGCILPSSHAAASRPPSGRSRHARSSRSSSTSEWPLGSRTPAKAAASYVCAGAVTNAVKHARASRAWLGVVHENGSLTIEVRDDGVGGAGVDRDSEASGSSGLPDRVEALDGTLRAESTRGSGTLLCASFPAAPKGRG